MIKINQQTTSQRAFKTSSESKDKSNEDSFMFEGNEELGPNVCIFNFKNWKSYEKDLIGLYKIEEIYNLQLGERSAVSYLTVTKVNRILKK